MPTTTTPPRSARPARAPRAPRIAPGARRAMVVRVCGAALACVLAMLAVVNPVLGIAVAVTILVAAAFTQSATFGICAFVFVTYFEFVTTYTGNTALSPIKVCGGALIVLALLELVTRARHGRAAQQRERPSWAGHPVVVAGVIGYVAVGMISASWAVNVEQVSTLSERLVTEVLIFLAIGVFLLRRGQFLALAWTTLVAGVLSTLIGYALGAEEFGRSLGTFTDPNEYAAAMVVSIGMGFGAIGATRARWKRVAGLLAIGLCSYGVLTSQSRGGLIALVVAAVVVVLSSRGRERVRLMGVTLVLLAAMAAVLTLTPTGKQSLERITDGDSSGRSDLWRIAQLQFRDNPVHGVGLGNYPAVAARYITRDTEHSELINNNAPRTTHNSYLEIAAELGLLGLVTFGTFAGGSVLLAARGLRMARRLGDEAFVRLGRGILASTLGLLASCFFLSGHYNELLWALLATCIAYHACAERQLRMARALEVAREVTANLPVDDLTVEMTGDLAALALQEGGGLPERLAEGSVR